MFKNFAKLGSPRPLLQYWHNFQTSLVLVLWIPNCTRHRMITNTNISKSTQMSPNLTKQLFQHCGWMLTFTVVKKAIKLTYMRPRITCTICSISLISSLAFTVIRTISVCAVCIESTRSRLAFIYIWKIILSFFIIFLHIHHDNYYLPILQITVKLIL